MITLATLSKATPQEVFDQAARHLLTQKAVSRSGGLCTYRSNDGLKCAAGCFIADEEYRIDMETCSWKSLIMERYAPEAHGNLIKSLQRLHDLYVPNYWPTGLRSLAADCGLSDAVVTG